MPAFKARLNLVQASEIQPFSYGQNPLPEHRFSYSQLLDGGFSHRFSR